MITICLIVHQRADTKIFGGVISCSKIIFKPVINRLKNRKLLVHGICKEQPPWTSTLSARLKKDVIVPNKIFHLIGKNHSSSSVTGVKLLFFLHGVIP